MVAGLGETTDDLVRDVNRGAHQHLRTAVRAAVWAARFPVPGAAGGHCGEAESRAGGVTGQWTLQAYRFALDPAPAQAEALAGHCHAARKAYNVMLAAVKANLDQRRAERSYGIAEADVTPGMNWSAYGLRRQWNRRKEQVAPWWRQYSKEAYACGCARLAAGLKNWNESKRGKRAGRRAGFPRFKSKHRATLSCTFTTGAIHVGADRKHVTLPVIGTVKTHESTRRLARRLEAGTARITTATIRLERGRWFVSFAAHVQRRTGRPAHAPHSAPVIGLDLGVRDLLVAATPDGQEVARLRAPKPLKMAQRAIRALNRKAARQHGPHEPGAPRGTPRREPSRGWRRTQAQLSKVHARVANLRTDALHKATTALAQQHQVIGVEDLAVQNLTRRGGIRKRGLNRSLADASLGTLSRLLGYKSGWYGSTLVPADRFYPSSKTCSSCGAVKAKLPLHERTYHCGTCSLVLDRDRNAAINLAKHALAQPRARRPRAGVARSQRVEPTVRPRPVSGPVATKPQPEPETHTAPPTGPPRPKARLPDL